MFRTRIPNNPNGYICFKCRGVGEDLAEMVVIGATKLVLDDDRLAVFVLTDKVHRKCTSGCFSANRIGIDSKGKIVIEYIDVLFQPSSEVVSLMGPDVSNLHVLNPLNLHEPHNTG